MARKQIAHYTILRLLGAGGMGEVYLARDTKLDRTVALKLLPDDVAGDPTRMRRFVQEAKAASALNHPNVCVIHEVGETEEGRPFIAMEHIEGVALAARISGRPLDSGETLDIGIQIADALDAAHSHGVIHRDIKPANILLTPRGQVKVLDFGLAKIRRSEPDTVGDDASTQSQTAPGVLVGTVHYMSPEQALGRNVDHRTDIFSLGIVLYEMATGRRPFSGGTQRETLDHIVHSSPEAIARLNHRVPPELERIIAKCLEKDPGRRYQSAREQLVDLRNLKRDADPRRVARGAVPHRSRFALGRLTSAALVLALTAILGIAIYYFSRLGKAPESLAVLPFIDESTTPDSEVLSDGLTESLIISLSQLPNLIVRPRNSVIHYNRKDVDARAAGLTLNVQVVLLGRVALHGQRLSVGVELVDVRNNTHIWGAQYNQTVSDILTMQEEITKEISDKLRFRLTGDQQRRLTRRYTENADAYQLYIRGRYFLNKRTSEEVTKAVKYFEWATQKDPSYALAYAGLADAHTILGDYSYVPPNKALPSAEFALARALQIDDTLAEAHTSLAHLKMYQWDWSAAEREFKRAIQLNPNYSTAHHWYANCLMALGKKMEAIAEIRQALKVDSLSLIINEALGFHLYLARDYAGAIEQHVRTLELDPTFVPAHSALGIAYLQQGAYDEAIQEFQRATNLSNGGTDYIAQLGQAYAKSGKKRETFEILRRLKELSTRVYVSPYYVALIYTALGDHDQVFKWLDRACDERSSFLFFLKVEPAFDNVRSDPRFQDLVRRVKLPP